MRQLSNRQLVLRVLERKIKKQGVGAPFRKIDYVSIAKARELISLVIGIFPWDREIPEKSASGSREESMSFARGSILYFQSN